MANNNKQKNGKVKGIGVYVGLLIGLILIASSLRLFSKPVITEKYSTITGYFEEQRVKEFYLALGSGELSMIVETPEGDKVIDYVVPHVGIFLDDIEDDVQAYNEAHPEHKMVVDYEAVPETPWWITMIPSLILLIGMGAFWFIMMRQARGGGAGGNVMGFAKAKPQMPGEGNKVRFADVAGAEEEKHELEEVVEFLKNPSKYNFLGARVPKGVLLMGPPGTGKTLLAKAVAGEAGVPFFSISGSDFVEMFVGVGASRVRDLFEQAKKNAPSIIFIDEIDAVGRHRGAGLGGGHDEREQTLNQLLVEMDGFGENTGVIVMAATNRNDILDPALLRPGRFDRQIVVGYPDVKGREAILKVHTRNKPLGPDVDLGVIAKSTAGFTGADLENLANEAALLAARENKKAITMEDIERATIKVVAGPEKRSHVYSEKEKRLTAFHEAGHAVCTYYMKHVDPVHQISIIPRGMAGGYTMSLPKEDKTYQTKREMQENLVTLLGGRMSEKLVLDDVSTGASNDLERVTKIARAMVTKYGFSDRLGPVVYGQDQGEIFLGRDISQSRDYSENVAAEIDTEVREIIENAYEQAESILTEHMDQLTIVATNLMEREVIEENEFNMLMEGKELPPLPEKKEDNPEEKPAELKAAPEEVIPMEEAQQTEAPKAEESENSVTETENSEENK